MITKLAVPGPVQRLATAARTGLTVATLCSAATKMTLRSCVLLGSAVLSFQAIQAQERAPNGAIYNELLPFVGLEGVQYQITGLQGPTVINIPGPGNVADPEKTNTGLTRAQREELTHNIYADVEQVLSRSGVPKPGATTASNEIALLAIDVRWARVKPDLFTVQVTVDLMEAARLIKDPSRVVWTSTWRNVYTSIASSPNDLPSVVRSVTRGEVESFARLYERAHTK